MGTNLPGNNNEALNWLEARIASWVAGPAGIGLTSAQVTDLALDVTNARTSFTSVQGARVLAKDGTADFNDKAKAMRKKASLLIADVKSYANQQQDPGPVYVAASITPNDPASPAAPPQQPTDLNATLSADGSVTINFSGRGLTGTVWEVERQLEGETAYTHIGHADPTSKSFTDTTVPGSVSSATYRVHGVRGSESGINSTGYTVKFGGTDSATDSAEAA